MSLFVVPPLTNSEVSVIQAVERALALDSAALATLPTLTTVAISDPYLLQQLTDVRQRFELRPSAAQEWLERVRTRLAWWLFGTQARQLNEVNASLVRVLDSLVVQIDHERAARRRIEEHLADTPPSPDPPSAIGYRLSAIPPPPSLRPVPVVPRPLPLAPRLSARAAPPLSLVWHSSFASPTGYSGSSRAFVLGLDARGVNVRPLYLYGTDRDEQLAMGQMHPHIKRLQALPLRLDVPQVVYAPADRFSKNSGSYRVGFSMLEVDRLPAAWVEQANQMHEVWTPTQWGAEVFRASGVQRPVYVVPLGVDTERFCTAPEGTRQAHLANRVVFLSVFAWGKRKGWDVLLRAFCTAFRPDDPVLLLLKIDCHQPAVNPVRDMLALLPERSPPIGVLYNQPLDAARLAQLYHGCDCFVLPSHGEGWGMPVLEAMACGRPAIATNWSGLTAFLSEANGYPLPIRGLVPTGLDDPTYGAARWAQPDEAALVDLLRHVAANRAERTRKGAQAASDARQWSWVYAAARVCERLESKG